MCVCVCVVKVKVKLKHLGGFLSSASFISCIAHYNSGPHSDSGSSFYCFHFIRFPLVFFLNVAVLFSPAPSLHLSDSPTPYRDGGRWERARPRPCAAIGYSSPAIRPIVCVCLAVCVLFRIHLINQANSPSPKGPSHGFIDAWPLRSPSVSSGEDVWLVVSAVKVAIHWLPWSMQDALEHE